MLPLYDENFSANRFPVGTIAIIVLNVLVFILSIGTNSVDSLGLVPERVLRGQELYTLITAMFVHANIIHLLGNMWFFWIFADNVENYFGTVKFILIYLFLGIVSSLSYVVTVHPSESWIPLIGASGAISGIMGMYIWMFPRNQMRVFFGFSIYWGIIIRNIPAYFFIGLWLVIQILSLGFADGVAYAAHIGGLIAGFIIAIMFAERSKRADFYKIGKLTYKKTPTGWEN